MFKIKGTLHPKIKICRKLPFHILKEPLGFIFSKNVCIFSASISGQKNVAPVAVLLASNGSTSGSEWQYFWLW